MDQNRRNRIQQLANAVRGACKLTTPVDVNVAIERLGGTLVEMSNPEYEAQIEKNSDGGFTITIAIEPHPNRKRFSIAHEIGHLFIHMGYLVDDEKWEQVGTFVDSVYHRFGHNLEEHEAHEFAASFLMPEGEFLDVTSRQYKDGYYSIDSIAEYFKVSIDAAKTRGRWLGIFNWSD
ncbi:MAG: ImmA/IrrE family metallo-endopeptidase [Syntrophobacteraceae bacterium]|nr:ImmA/IrrE family metallo-endopeptidase [Syntrophobacteraceae bacterium]